MSSDANATIAAYHARAARYRKQTAFHESAHWVAGLVGGLSAATADVPVTQGLGVSLVPSLQGWGRADVSFHLDAEVCEALWWHSWMGLPPPDAENRRLEAIIVMLLCGDHAAGRAVRDGAAEGEQPEGAEAGPAASDKPLANAQLVADDERDELLGRDKLLADVAEVALAAGEPAGAYDSDHALALLARCSFTMAEAEARLAALDARAQQFCENALHWHQITAVAEAALEHRELDGATALKIVEAAMPARPAVPEGWAS